jgi:ATP-dependent RNA helicase DDX20
MPRVERVRSEDVALDEDLTFADLQLSDALVRGLRKCGLHTPSPVQRAAIPLGRTGADLVVQAKSGTGKTITFGAILLERVDRARKRAQALVVAPTREVAQQSHDTLARLAEASGFADGDHPLRTHVAVGGVRVEVDRAALATGAHIVIGTPGRLRQLLEEGSLRADDVRLFVLDEADALTRGSFEADVLFLHAMLRGCPDAVGESLVSDGAPTTSRDDTQSSPQTLQTLAFSATYPPETVARVEAMTKNAARVELCTQATNGLLAVRQFYVTLQPYVLDEKRVNVVKEGKDKALLSLFARVAFHQSIVFVKRPARGEALAREIERSGVRAGFVSGATPQKERFDAMRKMRDFELRVLVSTDLTSRGVDLERVNLVVHMDVPPDAATYAHRVGRAGRFGGNAVSVAIFTTNELASLRAMLENTNHELRELPEDRDAIPADWYAHDLDARDQEKAEALARAGAEAAAAAAAEGTAEAEAFWEEEFCEEEFWEDGEREDPTWDEGADGGFSGRGLGTRDVSHACDAAYDDSSRGGGREKGFATQSDARSGFDRDWAARRAWASWWWWRWRDEQQAALSGPPWLSSFSFEAPSVGAGVPWVVPPLRETAKLARR